MMKKSPQTLSKAFEVILFDNCFRIKLSHKDLFFRWGITAVVNDRINKQPNELVCGNALDKFAASFISFFCILPLCRSCNHSICTVI